MRRYISALIIAFVVLLPVAAQSLASHRFEEHSLSLGGGYTNMLDTYLSPLHYSGAHASLMGERFAQTNTESKHWYTQSLFALHGDYATPRSGSGLSIGGMADYSCTYYYRVPLKNKHWNFYTGPQGQFRIGGIYNPRNSNNPAQLKLGVNLAASVMAKYGFTLWSAPMSLRLQTDIPLLGIAFAPDYGQSYYEIFYLMQAKGCVHLTSLHNNLSLRTKASYDVELKSCTLRFTWLEDLYHWQLGNQQYRMFTHTVMIGFVRNLYRVMRDEEVRQVIPY